METMRLPVLVCVLDKDGIYCYVMDNNGIREEATVFAHFDKSEYKVLGDIHAILVIWIRWEQLINFMIMQKYIFPGFCVSF